MKNTCPGCGLNYDVKEKRLLEHIERSAGFRAKVERLLNSLRGRRCLQTMTPQQRSARAANAAAVREANRPRKEGRK